MRVLFSVLALVLTLVPGRSRAADDTPVRQHRSQLVGTTTSGSEMGVANGASPSAAHPRGTVYVAWSLKGRGPSLTEWDLARATVVKQVSLGWGESNVRIVRAGEVLHVLVTHDDGRVGYARVDAATLRIACRAELGRGTTADIGADEAMVAAAWVDLDTSRARGDPRLELAVLDATCAVTRTTASVAVGWDGGLHHKQIGVLGARAYVVVGKGASSRVLAFTRGATLQAQLALPPSDRDVSLLTASGRLLLGVSGDILEVSTGLSITARHPCFCGAAPFMSLAADGRWLTSRGSILSSEFTPSGALQPARMWVHDVTWAGNIPVVLSTAPEPSSTAWIDWLDP